MKKAKKKLLGLLGLFAVAAITTFAAFMPTPEASAEPMGGMSVTDTVNVRVIGERPRVDLYGIEDEAVVIDPHQVIKFDYEGVQNVVVKIEYTDYGGNTHTYTLDSFTVDFVPGSKEYPLDLANDGRFGRGDYKVTARGGHTDSSHIVEDVLKFTYSARTGSVENNGDGTVTVDPGIDPEDDRISRVEVKVLDENGNTVDVLPPQNLMPPFEPTDFNFAEKDLETGWYTVVVTEYDHEDNVLHQHFYRFYYERPELPAFLPAPNTGAGLANLDMSRADTLITGGILFALVAAVAVFLIVKGHKKSTPRRHKH